MKNILFTLIIYLVGVEHAHAQETTPKGILVTSSGDTLKGNFKNFKENLFNYDRVIYLNADNEEKVFNAKDIKMVSTEGSIYESYNYFKYGAFSGMNAPGQKLLMLLYSSPFIKLYFFSQNNEYIYQFIEKKEISYYSLFNRSDVMSYMTNYNRKLSNIFRSCEVVKKKAQNGEYKLKEENSKGPVQALIDYEINCGSKEPERYINILDTIKNIN